MKQEHQSSLNNLIFELKSQGINDTNVLNAIAQVPREFFLPKQLEQRAYENCALPIDCNQTISQPYIVAAMTQALKIQPEDKILEVGTGSGYQAAILSKLAERVITIERHQQLLEQAQARFQQLGIHNIECHLGDGSGGFPDLAPYDGILVTAASPTIPDVLMKQLNNQRHLIIPVGGSQMQSLLDLQKQSDRYCSEEICPCRFVKLIGEQGWDEESLMETD